MKLKRVSLVSLVVAVNPFFCCGWEVDFPFVNPVEVFMLRMKVEEHMQEVRIFLKCGSMVLAVDPFEPGDGSGLSGEFQSAGSVNGLTKAISDHSKLLGGGVVWWFFIAFCIILDNVGIRSPLPGGDLPGDGIWRGAYGQGWHELVLSLDSMGVAGSLLDIKFVSVREFYWREPSVGWSYAFSVYMGEEIGIFLGWCEVVLPGSVVKCVSCEVTLELEWVG